MDQLLLKYMIGMLFLACIPVSLGAQTCNETPVFNLSDIHKDYSGRQAHKIYHSQDTCLPLESAAQNWSEGCINCTILTKITNDRGDGEFVVVFSGADQVSLFLNEKFVLPEKVGENRVGFVLPIKRLDTLNLKINFSIRKHVIFGFHHFKATNKSFHDFIAYGLIRLNSYFLHFAFLGAILIVALINLVTFFYSNRKDMLFYALYALIVLTYFGGIFLSIQGAIAYDVGRVMELMSQPIMYIAYIYFIKNFIDTRAHFIILDKVFNGVVIFLSMVFVVVAFSLFAGMNNLTDWVYDFYRIVAGTISLFVIYYLARRMNGLISFILIGTVAMTIGGLMAMFFTIYGIRIGHIRPIHWMMMGVFIELISFSAGVGYRTYLSNREKLQFQEALIEEMTKNEKLMTDREEQLNVKVVEARDQIIEEENQKLQAKFSLQEKEIELSLLRNQMNPHFIFNSLNSIKSFIIKNQPKIAGQFLTKFATLMRLILSNSKEKEVSLYREIDALNIYMELEQVRLLQKFSFEFNYEGVDIEKYFVQPLILQPFIENAIWHGIRHKTGHGFIHIIIRDQADGLEITIKDDGVGRRISQIKQKDNLAKSKSYGIGITTERLQKYYGENLKVSISDLYPEKEETGTIVNLYLPTKKSMTL